MFVLSLLYLHLSYLYVNGTCCEVNMCKWIMGNKKLKIAMLLKWFLLVLTCSDFMLLTGYVILYKMPWIFPNNLCPEKTFFETNQYLQQFLQNIHLKKYFLNFSSNRKCFNTTVGTIEHLHTGRRQVFYLVTQWLV